MAAGNGPERVSDFRSNWMLRMDKASCRTGISIYYHIFVRNQIKKVGKQKNYNNECGPAV